MAMHLQVLMLLLPMAFDAPAPQLLAQESDAAVAAYRAGDYDTARAAWQSALADGHSAAERARLTYNLGNAAFRAGDVPEAIGWYSASLALVPRDADAWANLELARSEARLEPADRGDLAATLKRLVTSVTLAESEWILLAAILLLAACLAGEALRGSAAWRRAAWASLALCGLTSAPWFWNLARQDRHPLLVLADGTAARSEPRPDAKRLKELALGTEVERLDELPGWIQIRDPEGDRLWVRATGLFDTESHTAGGFRPR